MSDCRICGNQENNHNFVAKEMMFGTREEFVYSECSKCKSIQIEEIPSDLSKYYPNDYYSFNVPRQMASKYHTNILRGLFAKYYMNKKYGTLLQPIIEWFNLLYLKILREAGCGFNARILDIGSGVGSKLKKLPDYGFENIIGSDPYISQDIIYPNGLKVLRKSIFDFNEQFDFIMFNHSFEHMSNPEAIMIKLNSLLQIKSNSMIRIPVADSYAWKKYRENWIALDAPRHIHIFSPKGFEFFIKRFGFKLDKIVFESSEYQFLGSEQYKMNIHLQADNSFYTNIQKSVFSNSQIKEFKKLAKKLNQSSQGDVACFYITKIADIENG